MSGYRFCRSDDIPLLVAAYNRNYAAHVEGADQLTVDEFKRDVRELDLWASGCRGGVAILQGEKWGCRLWAVALYSTPGHSGKLRVMAPLL